MWIPLLSRWSLKVRRQALLTEIEMHADCIRDLGHALLELTEPDDELAARVLDLLAALDE
jgi:hypothetical protein